MAVTRFAPSPTGYLHIGGLRTALYSYLWAKKTNGKFKLRIEDTDTKRNNIDAQKAIIEVFKWVGLDYDSEIIYQSQRLDIYKKYIQKLLDEEKAYYCYMSKSELQELRDEQIKNKKTPQYNGHYRNFKGKIPSNIKPVVRIKSPQDGTIIFVDGVKSMMNFECKEVDDFIIARSDGMPTYNFVVVVDDALMKITDIIRGDDHLVNTPKQIVIYNALNFNIPNFYHIPMINNPQGKKLSKRDGALDVMQYKKDGYLAEAVLNFLVRLGWSKQDKEIFSIKEMIELFNPKNINKSASSYNEQKLLWLNSHYIINSSNDRLARELKDLGCNLGQQDKKELILDLFKKRAKTLLELKEDIDKVLNVPSKYEENGVKKFIDKDILKLLNWYLMLLFENKSTLHLACDYEEITKPFVKEYKLKLPSLMQPLRIALTGGTKSPSVYELMSILGIDETSRRIDRAIKKEFN